MLNWIRCLLGEENVTDPNWDKTQLICANPEEYRKQYPQYYEGKPDLLKRATEAPDAPVRMIIQPPKLDMSVVTGGATDKKFKKFEFRPQTWDQFVGQKEAVALAQDMAEQFKIGMKAHMILSALPGHGKTSYIQLFSNSIGAHLIYRIGNAVTIETLPSILQEINNSLIPCVFFIDEIDTMDKAMIKMMNPVVESFELEGQHITPFVFACATINKTVLAKNNPDFLDRLKYEINFTRYEVEELVKIIKQVHDQIYNDKPIPAEAYTALALNSKLNPRIAISLMEHYIVRPNIEHVLKTRGIIKDGLTTTDIKILEYLATCPKPVGANAIALKCTLSQQEYEKQYEPFLFEFGYLNRLPSRVITAHGREFLATLKDK